MYTLVYSIQEAYTENQELAKVDLSATLDPFESNQFMLCSQAMSFLSKVVPCPLPSWFTLACLINPSTPKFNLKCCLFPWGLPWLYRPHFCLFSELLLHFSSVPSNLHFWPLTVLKMLVHLIFPARRQVFLRLRLCISSASHHGLTWQILVRSHWNQVKLSQKLQWLEQCLDNSVSWNSFRNWKESWSVA